MLQLPRRQLVCRQFRLQAQHPAHPAARRLRMREAAFRQPREADRLALRDHREECRLLLAAALPASQPPTEAAPKELAPREARQAALVLALWPQRAASRARLLPARPAEPFHVLYRASRR